MENTSSTSTSSTSDKINEKAVADWSCDDVCRWVRDLGYEEEAEIFKDEKIDGNVIMDIAELTTLKQMGIKVGPAVNISRHIKRLSSGEPTCEEKRSTSDKYKRKIKKSDKHQWSEEQRALYNSKTAYIIREAKKVWPSDGAKIIFRGDKDNTLKLEELVANLSAICELPEIGFGKEAIRSHIMQWANERNRTITNRSEKGYDVSKSFPPAKRARASGSNSSLSPSSLNSSLDSDDNVQNEESKADDDGSDALDDINADSARAVLMFALNCNSIHNLKLKQDLMPVANLLNIKCRSLGKYNIVREIAKELIKQGYVKLDMSEPVNFRCLKRHSLILKKAIPGIHSVHDTDSVSEDDNNDNKGN